MPDAVTTTGRDGLALDASPRAWACRFLAGDLVRWIAWQLYRASQFACQFARYARYQVKGRIASGIRSPEACTARQQASLACEAPPPRSRVLILEWHLPTPDKDAGSLRITNVMGIFKALGCQVTLYAVVGKPCPPYEQRLRQEGTTVVLPGDEALEAFLEQHGREFNLVLLSRLKTGMRCMASVRRHCPQALVAYDTVDLHFLREQRRAAHQPSWAGRALARSIKRSELRLVSQADLTLVVSPVEADLLRQEAPGAQVRRLSLIQPLHDCVQPFAQRKDLLFVGNFRHGPNVDGLHWFVREVFPEIRRQLPGVRLDVIGDDPHGEVRALASAGVRLLGHVDDLGPHLEHARVSVAPLRYGAGVKGKITMSLAYGLPVVSTMIGCEGMFLHDGTDVLVADTPQAFAAAVCRLYQDEDLWECLSAGGRDNVERHFSFDAAQEAVSEILAAASPSG